MRKQRTRQHVIEDLGFNYVERQILYAGFTVNRYGHSNDYGHDGFFTTFNEFGEIEGHLVQFQLKSTDAIKFSEKKKAFTFDLSKRDLELWLLGINKMLLILYDAKREVAYFEDLQVYFKKKEFSYVEGRKFIRIYVPVKNVLTSDSVRTIRLSLK
jgi:hypothetical protein